MSLRPVIGIHACREALRVRTSEELKSVYFKTDWKKSPVLKELAEMAKSKKMKLDIMSDKKMNQIGESHQGVCLFVSGLPQWNVRSIGKNSVILILDRVQDPKNLGALVRTAWLMGVDALFVSARRSVFLTASAAKAASGGLEHIPIEARGNLYQCIEELKKEGFWFYVLDSHSENSLWKETFEGRTAFVLGGEQTGVRKSLKKICDKNLFIFQKQKSASYNVSVAAAITLGECIRQRTLNV